MPIAPITRGEIGTIVTLLEMNARPALRAMPASELRLKRWVLPTAEKYRQLFRRVGEPWLWFSRLELTDAELIGVIQRPVTQIFAVEDKTGIEVGMLEIAHPEPDWCSLDFIGLIPELSGKGHGKWLMAQAMALAWRPGVKQVRVHTCTLDHPGALSFYVREGFSAVDRAIETFPDPRLTGLLPRHAAPQIPLIT
ncbi:MAG: GNAT family N-acetyltransferase [Sphingomonadaceae bacterium]|nr:GNAT family N-acetyltransferase [Sphingomonadaceae bacterium]